MKNFLTLLPWRWNSNFPPNIQCRLPHHKLLFQKWQSASYEALRQFLTWAADSGSIHCGIILCLLLPTYLLFSCTSPTFSSEQNLVSAVDRSFISNFQTSYWQSHAYSTHQKYRNHRQYISDGSKQYNKNLELFIATGLKVKWQETGFQFQAKPNSRHKQ